VLTGNGAVGKSNRSVHRAVAVEENITPTPQLASAGGLVPQVSLDTLKLVLAAMLVQLIAASG
jgi:hypothetical protein